ncbi:exosporium protein D [Bacillus gaemokensis]|uniref:Exosporium protein D n=1 Tax=Bacillus gaemokensis TaxID=574375 RepID=A0A073KTK5_9BACI|nr:exosporium protein D [Bacillus gaemokensis]KEK25713.1 exosporium protein D [Bacillus gaemokensis]KYG38529.1 exosporium protein D [Bacillus gaemokensis]
MADYFYKDGKKIYKKRYQSHSHHQKDNCFVETHTIAGTGTNLTGNIPLNVFLPTNTSRTLFEDFTNNHNKTLLQFFVTGTSAPIGVTIQTRGSRLPITAILSPTETRIFQVEDFQSLILSNATTDDAGSLGVFIQKTFCICCNDRNHRNDYCDEYYSEYDYDC